MPQQARNLIDVLLHERDPLRLRAALHYGWKRKETRTGKTKWVGNAEHAGQTRYQEKEPGTRKKAADKPAPAKKPKADPAQVRAHLEKLLAAPAAFTDDDHAALREALLALPAKDLEALKRDKGLRGGRNKAEVADRIHGHATGKTPEKKPRAKKAEARKPGEVYNIAPGELKVDPARFQFKLNVDKSGVTDELKSIKSWNPDFAGVLAVWRDPADGQLYVINGHHRHELASRLGVKGMAVREIAAGSAKEARAVGALINIAEGRGTAIDAAKFFRDTGLTPEDLAGKGISLKGKVAADAAALTNLSDRQFDRLARGLIDEGKALAVARHLKDHGLQDQLFHMLDKREESGKDLSPRVIEEMAREMALTPTRTSASGDLFGTQTEESLFVHRAELKAHVRAELASAANDFAAVASTRRAGRVSEAGNVLNVGENKSRADAAEQAKATFDTLANRRGPISDAINQAAGKLAAATTRKARDAAKQEAVKAVQQAIEAESGGAQPSREGSSLDGGRAVDRGGQAAGATRQAEPVRTPAPDQGRGKVAPPRVTQALKRFDERDSLPAAPGAGLFGGDDARSREGLGKLPEGTEVVLTSGPRRGQVGRIRHNQSLDGGKRVTVQVEGDEAGTPVSHDAVEPLDDLHSWRTPLGASGKKQGGMFDSAGYQPTQQSESRKAVNKIAGEINALVASGKTSGAVRGHPVEQIGLGRYRIRINGQTLEGDQNDLAGWIHAAGDRAEPTPGAPVHPTPTLPEPPAGLHLKRMAERDRQALYTHEDDRTEADAEQHNQDIIATMQRMRRLPLAELRAAAEEAGIDTQRATDKVALLKVIRDAISRNRQRLDGPQGDGDE